MVTWNPHVPGIFSFSFLFVFEKTFGLRYWIISLSKVGINSIFIECAKP
jgi:hypothetical protein